MRLTIVSAQQRDRWQALSLIYSMLERLQMALLTIRLSFLKGSKPSVAEFPTDPSPECLCSERQSCLSPVFLRHGPTIPSALLRFPASGSF
jgi:hypothetical protein